MRKLLTLLSFIFAITGYSQVPYVSSPTNSPVDTYIVQRTGDRNKWVPLGGDTNVAAFQLWATNAATGGITNQNYGFGQVQVGASALGGSNAAITVNILSNIPMLVLKTNNVEVFKINRNGDLSTIKSMAYAWPTVRGGANSVLTDIDDAGFLRWTNIDSIITNVLITKALVGVQTNGVSVGAGPITNINFITGANMTITGNVASSIANIGFASSGSGTGDTLWGTNAPTGGITNVNSGFGSVNVAGTNAVITADTGPAANNWLFVGQTNSENRIKIRADGSVFSGKTVGEDVNIDDFSISYPLYQFLSTSSNDPSAYAIQIGGADSESSYSFSSTIAANCLIDKDVGFLSWVNRVSGTNGHVRMFNWTMQDGSSSITYSSNGVDVLKVSDSGDLTRIKSLAYSWPTTNAASSQVLTSDGGSPQQLYWVTVSGGAAGTNSVAVAAGTNITAVTNSGLVTISVSNTNLPVAIAGTNVTIVTNGLGYTVSVTDLTNTINVLATNSINQNARIGPGTPNFMAKFTTSTNVTDSRVHQVETNQWNWNVRTNYAANTNSFTNRFYAEFTSTNNFQGMDIVVNPPGSLYNGIFPIRGSGNAQAQNKFRIWDSWDINGVGGGTAPDSDGDLLPVVDNDLTVGNGSKRVQSFFAGPIGYLATDNTSAPNFSAGWGLGMHTAGIGVYENTGPTKFAEFTTFSGVGSVLDMGAGGLQFGATLGAGDAILIRGNSARIWQFGTNNTGSGTAATATVTGIRGSGTDKTGGDFIVSGGPSTGAAKNGDIRFQSGNPAVSSSTLNTLVDRGIWTTNALTIYSNLVVNGTITGTVTGSQTPYTSDHNAAGFSVTNLNNITTTGTVTIATGSGTNYFGTNINIAGTLNATGITNSGLTASRIILTDSNKGQVSAVASGAVPVNADGSAATTLTAQTNSVTLATGTTTLNFVAGANTTVTGAVSGATATIGISASSSASSYRVFGGSTAMTFNTGNPRYTTLLGSQTGAALNANIDSPVEGSSKTISEVHFVWGNLGASTNSYFVLYTNDVASSLSNSVVGAGAAAYANFTGPYTVPSSVTNLAWAVFGNNGSTYGGFMTWSFKITE